MYPPGPGGGAGAHRSPLVMVVIAMLGAIGAASRDRGQLHRAR